MLSLFFFSLFYVFSSSLFTGFLLFFIFLLMNNYSWSGLFFFCDSYFFLIMLAMTVFIMAVILLGENNEVLVFLSKLLIIVCVLFFIPVNFFMLYIFFELSIFPILVMIMGYGSQVEKISSAYYLIFYAVFCSTPFLYVYFSCNFFMLFVYYDFFLSWEMIFILSLCFMVKFPVYFLHLWLPKAHVEAPTTASMLLAGLLLKLGTVGFYRLTLLMSYTFVEVWFFFALVGMIMCSFVCLFQSDVKELAAYSSIVHMSLVLFSLVVFVKSSKLGGGLMMLSHGYTSTLMFYIFGEFFHKEGTRMIFYLQGFMMSSLVISFFMMIIFLSNGALPPSLSFVSEFLVISSLFNLGWGLLMVLFVYFFIAFYYSIFILTSSLMGGLYKKMSNWAMCYIFPGLMMMFNFFWLGVLFS